MAHVHGHGYGQGDHDLHELTAASVRRFLLGIVAVIAVITLVGLAIWWPRHEPEVDTSTLGLDDRVDATVTSSDIAPCSYDASADCTAILVELESGPDEGTNTSLEFDEASETTAASLKAGDDIILLDGGADLPVDARYSFADMQRGRPLLLVIVVFAIAVVALGRLRGLFALAGIVLSVGVLLVFMFPALLNGSSPIGVALTGASVIAFGTIYLAHGINDRTTIALVGTFASLFLTAVLAVAFAGAADLSGLASEESLTLRAFAPDLDYRGLLLAAVVIGTLGVLDDVTITQVSAVWELHKTDPSRGFRQLYSSGIRIGRDHIASTVNTLVLAYSAAALPLLLLFTQSGLALTEILTSETVAIEVVQTLVGSIGLVASVPITTALACWFVTLSERRVTTSVPQIERPEDVFWSPDRR